jgi:glutathione synthase/RimK-type ligase-like ATP-grasp enzyme
VTGPRYVLIGNPSGKRLALFQEELVNYWAERGMTPIVEVVPWRVLIPCAGNLDELPVFDQPAMVRLDSHGKNDEVYKLLLEAGAQCHPEFQRKIWTDFEIPFGLILEPALAFDGLTRVLEGLHKSLARRPHLRVTANPLDILKMFDKYQADVILRQHGVATPDTGMFTMSQFEFHQADGYIKLNTGSSGCGIVFHDQISNTSLSTITQIDQQFYNTRRVRNLTESALRDVLAFLNRQAAIIQHPIRKATYQTQNFDVRVICINQQVIGTIFRVSRHPITNLHLGGHRGDWAAIRRIIPTRYWLDGLNLAVEAASCFDSIVVGVDLLFEQHSWRPYILEVNAYGNFFPGWQDSQGRSCHWHEIHASDKA